MKILILIFLLWALPVGAQIINEPIDADGEVKTLSPGDTKATPVTPKPTDDSIVVAISRTDWTDPNDTMIITVEETEDGIIWVPRCGASSQGGKVTDDQGNILPATTFYCPLRSTGVARKTQIIIKVVSKNDITAGVLLETK